MATRIQLRRDTASNWTSVDPTLAVGELGYETDTGKMKLGDGSTSWTSLGYYYFTADLADLSDVTISSAQDGDFLRWNGVAWINDAVNLGTDSVGDYIESITAGTGVTVFNGTGEGAGASVAIGQPVATSDTPTFDGLTLTGPLVYETVNGGPYDISFGFESLTDDRTLTFPNESGVFAISGSIELGADTVGDYISTLTAGTGVTIFDNGGEGTNASVLIGQDVSTSADVTFNTVTTNLKGDVKSTDGSTVLDSGTDGTDATFTGAVTGNASTASALETSRTIELTGDVTGSASFDGSANIEISTTIGIDSLELGTDTTGDYVEGLYAGTGVTIFAGTGEGTNASVAIGQAVATTDDVTFNSVSSNLIGDVKSTDGTTVLDSGTDGTDATFTGDVTGNLIGDVKATNGTTVLDSGTDGTDATFTGDVTGDLTGNASTASALQTSRTIELTGDVTGSVSFNGSGDVEISTTISADSISLGTDTTGSYVESLVAGTGVTLADNSGESATPTISIGQAVATTDDVTFNSVTSDIIGDVKSTNGTTVLDSGTDGTDATFTGDVTGGLTGNADTASALATGRTIELTGDVTGSVSFDGSGDVEISTTITADSLELGTDTTGNYVQGIYAGTGVTIFGGTGEGTNASVAIGQAVGTSDSVTFANVTVSNAPTQANHAATKTYVDTAIAGIDWHQAVKLASATTLPNSPAYDNGTSGVGATLTATAYSRLLIDGANTTTGDRVLVKDQSTATHNGVYVVTEQGNAVDTYWILTRANDFDASPSNEIKSGEAVFVTSGSTNVRQGFVLTSSGSGTDGAHVLDTDDLAFTQFTGTSAFTAGAGMSQSGSTINVGTASATRIVVNADDIDLATVSQSDTSGSPATTFVTDVTVDSYGRVTGKETSSLATVSQSDTSGSATTTFVTDVTVDSYGRVTGKETSSIDFADTALTGTPTAPTASVGDSSTQIATTAFVDAEIGDQAILKSVVDAKGDLVVASGADTVDRLAVGTNGYFLKANSSATNGVEWAAITETIGAGDLTDVVLTSATNGQILQYDGTNWVNTVQAGAEPIGHEDKSESTMSFNDGTRVFTISPVSSSFTVWCKGKRYVKTSSETVTIDSTTGLYYIYYSSSGVLSYRTSYFDWANDTPTAYIYWNNTTGKAEFFADERHGVVLDWQTHEYLHRTRGAAIANGFGASGYVTDGDGDSDSHAQIALAGGTFFDEDLQVDITHAASPTANSWEQVLEGTAEIPVFYRTNSAWVKDTATTFPFKAGTARAQYNLYSGGTWTTADVQNNKYGAMWIVATNNLNEPVIAILGQVSAENQSTIEERTWEDLDLEGLPIFEIRPLYKIIFVVSDGFTNTVKAAIRGVIDLRVVLSAGSGIPSVPVSDHGTMTGLGDDDHTQYLHITDARANVSANISTTGTIFASTLSTNASLVFEGNTADDNETVLQVTEPTSDRTIVLPDASGTVALLGTIDLGTDTTGNYVSDLSAGTGISVSHTPAEGSTATVALNATLDNLSNVSAGSPSDGQFLKYVSASSEWQPADIPTINNLDDVGDVTITFATSGDFLKWNGSAWVNDAVDLGTDTTGDYVESLVAGTGVTLSNNSGEGATPTVAIGQSVETTDSPTFAGATLDAIQIGITDANEIDTASGNLTIDSAGGTVTVDDNLVVSGDLTVNGSTVTVNSTVTTLDDPIITLGGDTAPGSNDSKDRGVEFRWHDGSNAKVGFFGYDESTGRLTFIPDATNTSEVFSGSLGSVDVADVYIDGTASTGTGGVVRATDPALAGTPTAPTASVGDSTTQIATTAFVDAEIGSQALLEADIAAKGDLIVGASAGTSAILSVGTDGYILKANSSATNGVEWVVDTTVSIHDDAPSSPVAGDLWWESDTGKLKIYYDDGSSAQWVDAFVGASIPSNVVTLTGTETVTNKTLTSPTINTPTVSGGTITGAVLDQSKENWNIVASAATGTINIDVNTASIWYYTSDASANHTINIRGDGSTTLASLLDVGDSMTVMWANTNGTTAYYPSTVQIDGTSVTPKWQGGSAPSAGNASSVDVYVFTIVKTAATPTYTVLASQTQFA